MRGDRQCRPHELPVAPSAQPELPPRRGARPGRRDPGDRDERSLGRAQSVSATASCARSRPITKTDAKIITLGMRDLYLKANYQDFGRYQDVDLAIAGDGEASLPALTEAVKRLIDDGRKSAFEARGKKLAAARLAMIEQAKSDATLGWDASPITTARMCAEVYAQIKDEDWSLVGNAIRNTWPQRLWDFDKPYQWNGGSGGAGVGYNAAGLARRGARQQAARPADGRVRRRRRLHVRAGHAVDRGAPPDPDALHHAQQPRLSSGSTCTCRRWRPGTAAASRTPHIGTTHQGSEHRLRHRRARLRRPRRRPDHRSEGSRAGAQARHSPWSRAASRRWSTSSPIRAEGVAIMSRSSCLFAAALMAAAFGARRLRAGRRAQDAPPGDAANGKRDLPRGRLLHLPRPRRAGRRR